MTRRAVLLQALASTPADIARIALARGGPDPDWRPSAGEWPVRDILSHLIEMEKAYHLRLDTVLAESVPAIPYIHPDERTHDRLSATDELCDQFKAARDITLAKLSGINAGDWQRRAIHETKGQVSLRTLVQDLIEHDIEHTSQLVQLQQAWRVAREREEK